MKHTDRVTLGGKVSQQPELPGRGSVVLETALSASREGQSVGRRDNFTLQVLSKNWV